jgi:hypothetical protein
MKEASLRKNREKELSVRCQLALLFFPAQLSPADAIQFFEELKGAPDKENHIWESIARRGPRQRSLFTGKDITQK